jgi:hypothetical protein
MTEPDDKKLSQELAPEKTAILDQLAGYVARYHMEPAAIMFIEGTRPLIHLGSQAMIFFEPFLSILFKEEKVRLFREAMEEDRYVEYLLKKIESSQK